MAKIDWSFQKKAQANPLIFRKFHLPIISPGTNLFLAVFIVLVLMLGLMVFSARNDAAIVDEVAHIPAGYSYLLTGNYRLNPEHPPLIKDLAALPLFFTKASFPYSAWQDSSGLLNNQWQIGWRFIYNFGNNPDQLIFLARLPVMILSLGLALVVFLWAREAYGEKSGLLALFVFVFDANILAHSRLVTTDLGMAGFLTLNLYVLWRFLKKPDCRGLILTGFTLGLAAVTKFSVVLVLPIYFIIFLGALFLNETPAKSSKIIFDFGGRSLKRRLTAYFLSGLSIFVVAFILTAPALTSTTSSFNFF